VIRQGVEFLAQLGDQLQAFVRSNTHPVGLLGVLMMIALVRREKARRSSSGSNVQIGGMQLYEFSRRAAEQGIRPVVFHNTARKSPARRPGFVTASSDAIIPSVRAAAHRNFALRIDVEPVGSLVLGPRSRRETASIPR